MTAMYELAALVLILAALALIVGPRLMRRGPRQDGESWGRIALFAMTNSSWDHGPRKNRGPRREIARGTLLVTGVSPRPDADGEQFVTIAGVINVILDDLVTALKPRRLSVEGDFRVRGVSALQIGRAHV